LGLPCFQNRQYCISLNLGILEQNHFKLWQWGKWKFNLLGSELPLSQVKILQKAFRLARKSCSQAHEQETTRPKE